jgi:hypothetical protein
MKLGNTVISSILSFLKKYLVEESIFNLDAFLFLRLLEKGHDGEGPLFVRIIDLDMVKMIMQFQVYISSGDAPPVPFKDTVSMTKMFENISRLTNFACHMAIAADDADRGIYHLQVVDDRDRSSERCMATP